MAGAVPQPAHETEGCVAYTINGDRRTPEWWQFNCTTVQDIMKLIICLLNVLKEEKHGTENQTQAI